MVFFPDLLWFIYMKMMRMNMSLYIKNKGLRLKHNLTCVKLTHSFHAFIILPLHFNKLLPLPLPQRLSFFFHAPNVFPTKRVIRTTQTFLHMHTQNLCFNKHNVDHQKVKLHTLKFQNNYL